jgi:hypothetical protein
MFQTATALSSRLSTSTGSKRSLTVATPRVRRGAFEDALDLRNGLVDQLLRDPDGPLRQLEVVEAGRRRCQLGQGLNLEGDAVGG